MENLLQQYLSLVGGYKLLTIMVLIVLDTIMGIALAVKNKQFSLSKWTDWLDTSILQLLGGYLFLGVATMAASSIAQLITMPVVMAMIDLKLLNDLRLKFQQWGVPIPIQSDAPGGKISASGS